MVLACATGALAGCGGDDAETATTPASPGAAATAVADDTAGGGEASPDSTDRPDADGDGTPDVATFEGELGESFILVGQPGFETASEEAVKLTVLKVIGPFKGFDVGKGNEIIGVQVRWEGVGEKAYNSPQPLAELTLASGAKGKPTSLIVVQGKDPCDNKSLELEKGKKVTSCLAFEVPKGDEPVQLKYGASSGYGDTGVWSLK